MGCDIHFYVEKRIDGRWVTGDTWTPDKYSDTPGALCLEHSNRLYSERHYDLFSILADVRNGRGFAGVETGMGFVPIFPPRGVPADACPEYAQEVERWDGDGHSHSWLTLQEILQFDWSQKSRKTGVVTPHQLLRWKTDGAPTSWSGMVSGPSIGIFDAANISEDELIDYLRRVREIPNPGWIEGASIAFRGCSRPHFRVHWDTLYSQVGEHFLSTTVPRMAAMADSWENVRAVFFFDN